jgi:NhaA family Na+:H+ antiporter
VRLARLTWRPLERFLQIEAASGILLLLTAAVAMLWANSPWAPLYHELWQTPIGLRVGSLRFEHQLDWYVNDGLMVIFFLVVGLEIRREIHHGELAEWRRAALPAVAALGGMLAPAGLYLLVAGDPLTRSGWGVPMATDIAFAVGILMLLGNRVPAALRVLLLALAVIDDLGAIVVIALFYSSGVTLSGLAVAALSLVGIRALQWFGVRSKLAYVPLALVTWAGVYGAGIHPTIAGVALGLMTPVQPWLGREASSPAESLIETLHPWVAFAIMPLFALANAGVTLQGFVLDPSSLRVLIGTALGLLLGKPIGVLLACWVVLRLGVATLPRGLSLGHLLVLGVVAGVGFTMALFVAQLAFVEPRLLAAAKIGVLTASGAAAVAALLLGRLVLAPRVVGPAEPSVDEVERSTEL